MEFAKLKALRARYRAGGIFDVLHRLSAYNYVPSSVLYLASKEILTLREINQESLKRRLTGYEFASVDASAIGDLLACQGARIDTSAAAFGQLFTQGGHCYVVHKGTATVAYFWVFQRQYSLPFGKDDRHTAIFGLQDDERFFGNGFIAEPYRLKGLFPYLVKFVMEQYPPHTKFFSAANELNAHSLKSHYRFGFEPLFRVTCLGILSACLFYRSKGNSRLGVFLGPGPARIELTRGPVYTRARPVHAWARSDR